MKRAVCLLLLACLTLLGACAADPAPAEFAVIDAAAAADGLISVDQRELALSKAAPQAATVAVYTADGQIIHCEAQDVTLRRDGALKAEGQLYADITGLLLNPPAANRGVYAMAAERLAAGRQTLILYVDGLGWDTWQYALEQGIAPCLSALDGEMAAACWPSITPVNYAAMVSGAAPSVTGIKQRGDRQPVAPTIFDYAIEQGYNAKIIEGSAQILELGVAQQLNPDDDGDGDTDDEVLAAALAAIAENDCDLLFVHFHGLDDTEHQYGPHTAEAYAKLAEIDAMVGYLLQAWTGGVIVCSDHGQHQSEDGGSHGDFRAADILVPLLHD